MPARLTILLASAATAFALVACSPAQDPAPGPSPAPETAPETGTPTAPAQESEDETDASQTATLPEPGEEVPEGMDLHDVTVFQLAIPSEWTAEEPTDEPTLAFWGEEKDGAPEEGAMLRWEPEGSDARAEAEKFVQQLEADGITATLDPLAWPGVPEGGAHVVTFEDELTPGATRLVQQIFAELPQGGLGTVIGFSEPGADEGSRVAEVLGSFRVAP